MIDTTSSAEKRLEAFLKEYSKLCAIFGMGIKFDGSGLHVAVNGYCDGYEIFDPGIEIKRIAKNTKSEHLEPISLEVEYIREE